MERVLLLESFQFADSLRILVFVQFCVESKRPIHESLLAVACAFREYAFCLPCRWNEDGNRISKPNALHPFTVDANHSLLLSVDVFYCSILLFCIINRVLACGICLDDLQYLFIIILISVNSIWYLYTLLSYIRHFKELRLIFWEASFIHHLLFTGCQALGVGCVYRL